MSWPPRMKNYIRMDEIIPETGVTYSDIYIASIKSFLFILKIFVYTMAQQNLVVKPTTIRSTISIDASLSWNIHQLDVKNTFCMASFMKRVYAPTYGFSSSCYMLTQKVIIWFKQVPRA